MSYCIEYNRQFIKSKEGITPVWLSGDNNVTESTYAGGRRTERRARDWSCFNNMLGVTEADMLACVQSWTGKAYEEHWKRNGKWVDDKALVSWVKSGCKHAATLEEIFAVNPGMMSIRVCVDMWTPEYEKKIALNELVRSTAEFDDWIRRARIAAQGHCVSKGNSAYFVVSFDRENLVHPNTAARKPAERVLLKRGSTYCVDVVENRSTWSEDIRNAAVLDYDAALELQRTNYTVSKARLVNAKCLEKPYDAVIRFASGSRSGYYIRKCNSRSISLATEAKYAYHYPTRKDAEKAVAKMQPKYAKYGTLEVVLNPASVCTASAKEA